MKILLDTNALIWIITDNRRIIKVKDIILSESNEIYISTISFLEIAIKLRIGKIVIDLQKAISISKTSGFKELNLSSYHALMLLSLPIYHKDPFDHMILSQAKYENMTLVTGDSIFKKYLPDTIVI